MTIDKREVGPNLRDTQIAIARAFGLSKAECGKRVSTDESPAGVSERTVQNRYETNGPYIAKITEFVALVRRELEVTATEMTRKDLRESMEKELGTAWAAIVRAVKSGDVDSAWRMVEHQIGKPNQVHKHEGDVNVTHTVWQGRRELLQQEQDMLDSEKLLSAAPALEAEVVEI